MSPNRAAHTRILEAQVAFVRRPFLRPLHLSSGVISAITEAQAEVRVAVDGREATGRGAIYLSDLWAWPDAALPHVQRDAALRLLCEKIATDLPALCGGEAAHPLELGLRLHHNVGGIGLEPDPPMLARVLCASPFDAALHDATGQALGLSAFALYQEPVVLPSADPYFVSSAAWEAIARTLRPVPVPTSDAWLVVGSTETLETEVAPWVRERGYRAFKLKLLGRAVEEDAARTVAVFRAVREFGARAPRLCADPNGAYPDAASVRTYLETVRAQDEAAFAALEYLEQPTERDITTYSDDWEPVTQLKPVLLDEGLTGFDVMETARAQGWSGFALKTCKGHSFALTAAAWAQQNELLVALQDLTNPGIAALHAALLAAYVPTINGVELNSPQFTPAANADVLPYLSTLLEPRDGTYRLPVTAPPGLGTRL